MALIIFAPLVLLAIVAIFSLKWRYSYWRRKNVPYLKPSPLLGNYKDYILLKKTFGETTQTICQKLPEQPYIGAYYGTEPTLIVQDPHLIKLITTKDFFFFNAREVAPYTDRELTTQNLFFGYGDTWKAMRHSMTPMFTPVKMKNMYPLIQKCSRELANMLDYETSVSKELDVMSMMARYTMDCIGSAAFGVDTNTMNKEIEKNPFRVIGDVLFEISYARAYSQIIRAIWPSIFYGLRFQLFPKKMSDFFHTLLIDVFEKREFKPSSRNDFVDLILNLKRNDYVTCDNWSNLQTEKKIHLKVEDDLLVSQCEVIFAAGYETSATTMGFTLYELAKNEMAQQRALEEVDRFVEKHGESQELEYEHLPEFPYVEACIDEAMRLYPVLGTLTREVVHEYTLPTGLLLEKGMRIHLPVFYLHHNPDHFPEPERFRPERFSPEEKHTIKPYTYMPFGEGGRICIGLRFGKMVTVSGLVTTLRRYRVELPAHAPRKVQLEPRALVTRPTKPIRLTLIPRY